MNLRDIEPDESEEKFSESLRFVGVPAAEAKRHARKQVLLRSLHSGITHTELVYIMRRLVDYL